MSRNHQEICHLWASGKKPSAQGFNVYFNDRELYSYGSHFLLGFKLSAATFVLNSSGYSVSTSKHKTFAWRAAHGRVFHAPDLTRYLSELRAIARHANGPADTDAARQMAAEAAAVRMVRDLAPGNDELRACLADLAGIPPKRAAVMIRGADRTAGLSADRAAKAEAKSQRTQAARYARQPWVQHAARIGGLADVLRTGTEYQARDALWQLERIAKDAARMHRQATKAGLSAQTVARIWRVVKLARLEIRDNAAKAEARQYRQAFREAAASLRAGLANMETAHGEGRTMAGGLWAGLEINARRLASADKVTGPIAARLRLIERLGTYRAAEAERQAAEAEAARQADRVIRWRAGESVPGFYCPSPHGGAMVRAKGVERDATGAITGGLLETSQGASVPLPHAVRAFQFVKLCRERGQGWKRNGRVVRVGYYTLDSISADGGFKAGCHQFAWPEIEALALALGVFNLPASDAAAIKTESVA